MFADGYVDTIIATEIFSILVCTILLYGNLYEKYAQNERGRLYSELVATNIVALIADALTWYLEGDAKYELILRVANFLSTTLTFVLIAEFTMYIYVYIKEHVEIDVKFFKICMLILTVLLSFTAIGSFTGLIYTYHDGIYVYGPLYIYYVIANAISLVVSFSIIASYRKVLGTHDMIATFIYIFIPILAAIGNVYFDNFLFTYQSITLSLLILRVMIQTDRTSKLVKENEITAYMATHDSLTDLFSRRAYVDTLDEIVKRDNKVGVLFCDINALKTTNDLKGHKAGDELIIKFAEILKKSFRIENIYRISGDEFVVVIPDINEIDFVKRVNTFEKANKVDDIEMASYGKEYGDCANINKLLQLAETKMYEYKESFYKKHPKLKR